MVVLAWTQEQKEYNLGKSVDGLLVVGTSLGNGIQGVEDGDMEGLYQVGVRVFSLV